MPTARMKVKANQCRLCLRDIIPSNKFYNTPKGQMRTGNCICHEYILDETNNRWYILEGNHTPRARPEVSHLTRSRKLNLPKHREHIQADNTVLHCINCRERMLFRKDYSPLTGYINCFRCPSCTREQEA